MEAVQPTLAEQLAPMLVMLICTSILTFIGFLLSYQLSQRDAKNKKQDDDLEELKHKMIQVRMVLGFGDRPSDAKKKGSSA